MAEILLMKSVKLMLDCLCFFTAGVAILKSYVEPLITKLLIIYPPQDSILLVLSYSFLGIRIVWFAYDKCFKHRIRKYYRQKRDKLKNKLNDKHK